MLKVKDLVAGDSGFDCATNDLEMLFCEKCDFATNLKTFLMYHNARRHLKNHSHIKIFPKQYKCSSCSYGTYSLLFWYKHHVNGCRKLDKLQPLLTCLSCSYTTTEKSLLEWHHATEHPQAKNGPFLFTCGVCTFVTNLCSELSSHLTINHKKAKFVSWFYKCVECNYLTKVKAELDQHVKEHQFRFKCKQCRFVEESQQLLDEHVAVAHLDEEEWFTCPCCPYKVTMELSLRKHIKNWHPEYLSGSAS